MTEFAVFASIAAAVVCWAVGEAGRSRIWWTAGAALALLHSLAAFGLVYGWSHDTARRLTAQQTAALTGLEFGGGIYVNYLFLLVWLGDAAWWWALPQSYARRSHWLSAIVRAFILFVVVNGAVIFADGIARLVGVLSVAAVLLAWTSRYLRVRHERRLQTCADVRTVAATIDGWLSDAQGCALFEAAAATTGKGLIVEIGSWKGRSTTWLAAGARRAGARVYAIDPHTGSREDPDADTLAEFRANVARAGIADVVEPLVMTSTEAALTLAAPVELLFIDGDHSYEGARRDAELWLPRLVEGGVVMFHDVGTAGYDGPRRVFRESICWNEGFDSIARIGSMTMARRTRRRRLSSAAWAHCAGLLLYLYDAKRALRRVANS